MSLAEVRIAMMESLATLSGVDVPQDPLPREIEDKTIVVFPRIEESSVIAKGVGRGLSLQTPGAMQVEYHRRVPYEHLGSTFGDVSTMIGTISDLVWKEQAGGKFDGTVLAIRSVALEHFGALGWNEWTFGARLVVSFTYLTTITVP